MNGFELIKVFLIILSLTKYFMYNFLNFIYIFNQIMIFSLNIYSFIMKFYKFFIEI